MNQSKSPGFYVFTKQDYHMTEEQAKQLIRTLFNAPHIQWEYSPKTRNANAFVGNGVCGGTSCIELSMHAVPGHHSRVLLDYWQDGQFVCSITDLCYEPEKSELRQLFSQVAGIVHRNPKPIIRYLHLGYKA